MSKTALTKNLVLGSAAALIALAFGYFFRAFIDSPTFARFLIAAIVGIVFLAVFLIQSLLASNFWVSAAAVAVEVLALALFFFANFSLVLAVGVLSSAVILILAYYYGHSDMKSNVDINFLKTAKAVMAWSGMALAIFASFAYVSVLDLGDPVAAKKTLEAVIKPAEPIVAAYVPGFTTRSTIGQIAAKLLPPDLTLASDAVKSQFITELSARLSQTFGGFLGVKAMASDSVLDLIHRATISRLLNLSPFLQNLLLIATAILLFFFVKFVLFFADWLAVGLAYLFFQLLLKFGFFRFELQNVPKKIILLE